MKKINKAVALLMAAALLTSVAGCAKTNSSATDSSTKYKYGTVEIPALSGAVCGAPAYIAYEKGFFAKEGINAQLVASGDISSSTAGLESGEFSVVNGDFQWFPSIQNGTQLRVIGGLHFGCIKIVVPPNSTIKSAKDLKGKRIGIDQIGGTPNNVASIVLANAGINVQTGVTWVVYPDDQLVEATKKGEIDAFAAWDPFGTEAVQNDGYKVLTDIATDPLFKNRSCCFLYASQKAIDANPAKIEAIAKAYQEADAWIQQNTDATAEIEINKKYVASSDPSKDLPVIEELLKSYNFHYTTDNAKNDVSYFVTQLKKTGYLKADTNAQTFANQVYYNPFTSDHK